jgi:hypothetical protein
MSWLKRALRSRRTYTSEEARKIGERIGINWATCEFPVEEFRMGLAVELEHGEIDEDTNITDDGDSETGKIAWAHLKELSDYYTRLRRMEREAE